MRNPTRRSKKIGLTQGGRVKDGKAYQKWSRYFTQSTWRKLTNENANELVIIRENPSRDYFHPCTKTEVKATLDRLPKSMTKNINVIVLRRITVDDEMRGVEASNVFGCIVLNSFPKDLCMRWYFKPAKAVIKHYQPWCDRWEHWENAAILYWEYDELKRYYLYHLLLHEIGHINDGRHESTSKREAFAENFALDWARKLGELD